MSYCLNPVCQKPQNPNNAKFCQNCGTSLLLGDRYRALKPIGQGGFGKTFLAVDESPPSPLLPPPYPLCVIKQSLPSRRSGLSPDKAIALFRREVERLKLLGQHPQIPRLLNDFEQEDGQYLVQEYIDGRNLAELLETEGVFSEARVRQVLNELLPVLQFIHEQQVIHRDIKPENIIYPSPDRSKGEDHRLGQLVLVDFGASKYATKTSLARTGTVIGSAGYVAPEQAMGRAEFASDLYSLGVTCVHLLTALHPFDLYSVSEDRWVWRQYLSQPVSGALIRVLEKMLQKATSQRYRTADEVLQDLNRRSPLPGRTVRRTPVVTKAIPRKARPAKETEPSWREVKRLTGHEGSITAIALSPNGRTLASGGSDKAIRIWDLATGELLHTFSGRSLWSGDGHSDPVTSLTFARNGQDLISGGENGTIKIWDLNAAQLFTTLPGQGWGISALGVSGNSQILASGSGDGTVNLWDLETEEPSGELIKHRDRITTLILSPSGVNLASSSYDKTIRLWNLQTRSLINTLRGHTDRVSAIALTAGWHTLVSASCDKTIRLWNARQGILKATIAAHKDPITSLAISSDEQIFASGSEDSTIKLWDLSTGNYLTTLRQSWSITALCFTPDGAIVSSSSDETIRLWRKG